MKDEWVPSKMMVRKAISMMTGAAFNEATSREDGAGQFVGNMLELAFHEWCLDFLHESECDYIADKKKHHDFILCGVTFDAKAKERTVVARQDYHCMVETRIRGKDCQYYVFGSVKVPELGVMVAEYVQLLGFLHQSEFWALPRDEDGKPDKFPCHKVMHSRLRPMSELKDNLELLAYKIAFGEVNGAA